MAVEHSQFATELNRLLGATSLSAEEAVAELNRQGFPVPQHTFSYWLQGYFLPRNESAFQLVAILENFFGVSDNRLSDALLVDLSSGFSFVPGENVQAEVMSAPAEYKRFFDSVYDSVDWEATLIQKVVRDEVFLSADHKYQRHKVTVFARVPSVPNPTFFSQILHETGVAAASDEVFYDLSGITLKSWMCLKKMA